MGPSGEDGVADPIAQNSLGIEPPAPPEQLSGVAVVIIIAVGVQTFIMLFIFAKRQIMRFTLRSRRGPHVSVGQGGVKAFRREIDRRLDYASHMRYEPKLGRPGGSENVAHKHRVVAVDKIAELDDIIARYDLQCVRPAGANIRSFLIECLAGPLVGLDPKQVHRFCDMYEHARHSYRQFGQVELHNYLNLLAELKSLVGRNTQSKPSSPKKSSTPQHHKPVNRPKRRIVSTYSTSPSTGSSSTTTVVHRNSSAVLMAADDLHMANSTQV
eukprot:GFUD01024134.1.p1 GENE.GFUD01024134.1~~GFUD01024134.1.p1  ORF type:complete len:270 (+),score=85.38 GFUD01024134.1:80-889(+)